MIRIPLLLVINLLILGCDSRGASTSSTGNARSAEKEAPPGGAERSLQQFFDFRLGSECSEVYEKLGRPDADRGSGVMLAEYNLAPHGSVLLQCAVDVRWIRLSWSSDPQARLPCPRNRSEFEQLAGAAEGTREGAKKPELFTAIASGSTRAMVMARLGEPLDEHQQATVRFPLIPRGWSEAYFSNEDRVERIDIIWLSELEEGQP